MSEKGDAYARALVEVGRAEDALDVLGDELLRVAEAVRSDRELHDALTDQHVAVEGRLRVVDQVLQAAHPATRSAVALLVAAGRARDLDEVAQRVAALAAEERQRALAEVRVAVPLSDERKEELRKALERATGKQLELKVFVDPSVVGGVRAKIGDMIIDGSLARRIDDLEARLTGAR